MTLTQTPPKSLGRYAIRDQFTPIPSGSGAVFAIRSEIITAIQDHMSGPLHDGSTRAANYDGKGFLATMVKVTVHAAKSRFPLTSDVYLTGSQGQVKSAPVEKIMHACGVRKPFTSEAGRTSRGTIGYAQDYATLLNGMHAKFGDFDLSIVLVFWIKRIRDLLNKEPIEIKYNPHTTASHFARGIVEAAKKREKSYTGNTILGTVMQHLTGALLEMAGTPVQHSKANKADRQYGRKGDFDFERSVWHVTSAPTEGLITKCIENTEADLSPVIVTLEVKRDAAAGLADNRGYQDKIEIHAFEALLAQHIDRAVAGGASPSSATDAILDRYNEIVLEVEMDRSLRLTKG